MWEEFANLTNFLRRSDVAAFVELKFYDIITDEFDQQNDVKKILDKGYKIPLVAVNGRFRLAGGIKPEMVCENYNKETADCLLKLVEYLPSTYKEAIIESDYNGEKQSILGQKWGLSNSGSKNRIQRARKKLRHKLLSCCEVRSDNAGNIIEFQDNVKSEFSCIKC